MEITTPELLKKIETTEGPENDFWRDLYWERYFTAKEHEQNTLRAMNGGK